MGGNTSDIKISRIALFGDNEGIGELLKYLPKKSVACFVCASIRPQYFSDLRKISYTSNVPLLIQPRYTSSQYEIFFKALKSKQIDLVLCNSYSMVIRDDVLKLVDGNAVNIHYALLPKNRGPNPVQWALIKGEKETGVTMHYITNKMDAGDIISQKKFRIEKHDSWVTLMQKCKKVAHKLMKNTIPLILNRKNTRIKQDETEATENFRLTPEFPEIRFKGMTDLDIYNMIRAQVKPLQGAYIVLLDDKTQYFPNMLTLSEIKKLRRKYGNW